MDRFFQPRSKSSFLSIGWIACLMFASGVTRIFANDGPSDVLTGWMAKFKDQVAGKTINDLESILPHLPKEMRENFSLVFESRSPIGSSLETPRVVMRKADATVVVAFAGNESMPGGKVLEVIQSNPATGKFEFGVISFAEGKNPKFIANPPGCASCHSPKGFPQSLRPIWDTYPDWPGIYGMSHNGATFSEEGGLGTSGIRRLDFEKKGYEKFLAGNAKSARYRILKGFEPGATAPTLRELSEMNNAFGKAINERNGLRVAYEMSQNRWFIRDHGMVLENMATKVSAQASTINDAYGRTHSYYEDKRERLVEMVNRLGSPADRAYAENGFPITMYLSQEQHLGAVELRFASNYALFEQNARKLGVDPVTLATTRMTNSLAFEDGESRIGSYGNRPTFLTEMSSWIRGLMNDLDRNQLLDQAYERVKSAGQFLELFALPDVSRFEYSWPGFGAEYKEFALQKFAEFLRLKPNADEIEELLESPFFKKDARALRKVIAALEESRGVGAAVASLKSIDLRLGFIRSYRNEILAEPLSVTRITQLIRGINLKGATRTEIESWATQPRRNPIERARVQRLFQPNASPNLTSCLTNWVRNFKKSR